MQTQLGDARSGKLVENLLGFGRALRRAGIAIDSAKLSLARLTEFALDWNVPHDSFAGVFSLRIYW
jgi:hypothetical protein